MYVLSLCVYIDFMITEDNRKFPSECTRVFTVGSSVTVVRIFTTPDISHVTSRHEMNKRYQNKKLIKNSVNRTCSLVHETI